MKLQIHILMLAAFAATLIAGCTGQGTNNTRVAASTPFASPSAVPTFSPPVQQQDNVERITLADAKKEFDAGTAVFIDVRSPDVFKIEHIKGALNIMVSDLDANINKIPKGKRVIAYCS